MRNDVGDVFVACQNAGVTGMFVQIALRFVEDNLFKFACVDGPEFDASKVNFEVLMQRNNMYREQERASIERLQADPEAELKRIRDSVHSHECAAEAAAVSHE